MNCVKNAGSAKAKKHVNIAKRLILQTSVAVVILIYCTLVIKTDISPVHRDFVHNAINVTADGNYVRELGKSTVSICRHVLGKCGEFFDAIVYFCNYGFGKPASDGDVYAMEHPSPAIYPQQQIAEQTAVSPPDASENADTCEEAPVPAQYILTYPVQGRITSAYGTRVHPVDNTRSVHYGIDIAANHGDRILSAGTGSVSNTGYDTNLGNYVKIKHTDSMETVYGHMSEILVAQGAQVTPETCIGLVGATGSATGPHVHLEVRIDGVCTDPMGYLPPK